MTLLGIAEGATHEGKELWLRSRVAGCLFEAFFGGSGLFGFADHLGGGNPLRKFEERLKASQCDGMYPGFHLRAWLCDASLTTWEDVN